MRAPEVVRAAGSRREIVEAGVARPFRGIDLSAEQAEIAWRTQTR